MQVTASRRRVSRTRRTAPAVLEHGATCYPCGMPSRLRLRELRPDDVALIVREGDGMRDARRLRARIARGPTLERDGFLELGVEVDGTLVGDVQARCPPHAFPPGVCELGISLFAAARGRGYGREAVERFTELLFRDHGFERVQASTSLANEPMRRVLEALGWSFEGILRGYFPGEGGGREDYALYALTRNDRRAGADPGRSRGVGKRGSR